MAMRLVLRTHPADWTLLEISLKNEQGRENRVARAPLANPRAWEWTTPPPWLPREIVEHLLDEAEGQGCFPADAAETAFHYALCHKAIPGAAIAWIEIDGPRLPGVKALQKGQETALATMRDSLTLCTIGPTGVIE